MGLFEWAGDYINPAAVERIQTGKSQSGKYPHSMTVYLRNGQCITKNYDSELTRRNDVRRLVYLVEQSAEQLAPVTRYEVETLVKRGTEAIRRDLRKLSKEMSK